MLSADALYLQREAQVACVQAAGGSLPHAPAPTAPHTHLRVLPPRLPALAAVVGGDGDVADGGVKPDVEDLREGVRWGRRVGGRSGCSRGIEQQEKDTHTSRRKELVGKKKWHCWLKAKAKWMQNEWPQPGSNW